MNTSSVQINVTTARDAQRLINLGILSAEEDDALTKQFGLPEPLGRFKFVAREVSDLLPRDPEVIGIEDCDPEGKTVVQMLQEVFSSSQEFASDMMSWADIEYDVYLNGELLEWENDD